MKYVACTGSHPGLGFTWIDIFFVNICAKKQFFNLHPQWPWPLTSKSLSQLLVTWVTFPLSLNVVWFFIFELTVATNTRMEHKVLTFYSFQFSSNGEHGTDRWIDRWTGCNMLCSLLAHGCIITELQSVNRTNGTTTINNFTFWRLQLLVVFRILITTLIEPANWMNVRGRWLGPVIIVIGPPIKMNQQLPVTLYFSCNVKIKYKNHHA